MAGTLGGVAEDIIQSFGEAIAQRVGPHDSTKHLFHCVGGIPSFGCITFQPSPPQWTVCVCVCIIELVIVLCFKKNVVFGELELAS